VQVMLSSNAYHLIEQGLPIKVINPADKPGIVGIDCVAVMANGKNAAVESDPVGRRRLGHRDAGGGAGVSRLQRLAGE